MLSNSKYTQQARSLGFLLRSPYQKLSKRIYERLHEQGFPDVRYAHSSVLRNIEVEGSRLTDLASEAGMAKQSMAYLVDSLCQAGYVEISPDPKDRRAKRVKLSRRGESLMKALLAISEEIVAEVAEVNGTRFVRDLKKSLEELDDALE